MNPREFPPFPRFRVPAPLAPLGLLVASIVLAIPPHVTAQTATPVVDPAIHPGDLIRLEVWQEEDLTGEFLVDQHRRVTLPLVGEVDVTDHTELSLRALVRERIQASVWNPSIQLFVLKRIRVLGEVMEPGVFNLDGTMSVADALALAGGRTPLAKSGQVVLRRADERIETDVNNSALLSTLNVGTGDELLVPRLSWLERNAGPVITGTTGVLGVIVLYLVNN